ncbi:hypothetical protein NDU88_000309 [Pleurodeles waltl]|uniref:Uncharacterized protein n=1 Tax=Pleurodeles waltl TaxID=8319 RepID=A0AAV7P9B6_PLEWA|nr:hypothetical protein NDU88_000309 [Pleurodeles waltl]
MRSHSCPPGLTEDRVGGEDQEKVVPQEKMRRRSCPPGPREGGATGEDAEPQLSIRNQRMRCHRRRCRVTAVHHDPEKAVPQEKMRSHSCPSGTRECGATEEDAEPQLRRCGAAAVHQDPEKAVPQEKMLSRSCPPVPREGGATGEEAKPQLSIRTQRRRCHRRRCRAIAVHQDPEKAVPQEKMWSCSCPSGPREGGATGEDAEPQLSIRTQRRRCHRRRSESTAVHQDPEEAVPQKKMLSRICPSRPREGGATGENAEP